MPHPLGLPKSTVALAGKVPMASCHPGLQLDKFSHVGDQAEQKIALDKIINTRGDAALLKELQQRRQHYLAMFPGITAWQCQTAGPFTLHLARASALENAGICLHPLYGFVYLPGSGLKGMARAYAETVWLPTQSDQTAAWHLLEDVFGWAPNRDRLEQLSDAEHPAQPRYESNNESNQLEIAAHTGAIIFHDAWPQAWPRLMLDIVNNHHGDYYSAKPEDTSHAPGDWENPVPVYFLAVAKGTVFSFAVSKRREDTPAHLVTLARQWLTGALCYLGAGAKTAAGYGTFAIVTESEETKALQEATVATWASMLREKRRHEFRATITILSPAFLGGADNLSLDPAQPLRTATLKAMLRFWWRAYHGHWPIKRLREAEAHIFGDTEQGQGLRVSVRTKRLKTLTRDFEAGGRGSPLGYLGYGPIQYSSQAKGNRSQREAIDVDSTFEVVLTHRDQSALEEATCALWLLGGLGGLGSRTRRGWGSLNITPDHGYSWPHKLPVFSQANALADVKRLLDQGLDILVPPEVRQPATALQWTAIGKESQFIVSQRSFANWQQALEDIGGRLQKFRSRYGANRNASQEGPGPDYHHSKALLTQNLTTLVRLPERAAFGLPYAQEYGSLRRNAAPFFRVEYIVVPHDAKADAEGRRASPLLVTLLPVGKKQVAWMVVFLPALFAPQGHHIRVKRSQMDAHGRAKKHLIPLDQSPPVPGPHGIQGGLAGTVSSAQSSVSSESTLVRDFLRHLQGLPSILANVPAPARPAPTRVAPGALPGNRPAPQVKPKPVNKGQTRPGRLHHKETNWVVLFDGDEREAFITNPDKMPAASADGSKAEFYIEEASKQVGIRARFMKLL